MSNLRHLNIKQARYRASNRLRVRELPPNRTTTNFTHAVTGSTLAPGSHPLGGGAWIPLNNKK